MTDHFDDPRDDRPIVPEYNPLYEAELQYLGSILKNKNRMEDVRLTSQSFSPAWNHGTIFQMLKFAYKKFGKEPDPFNLAIMASHWKEKLFEVGGPSYFLKIHEATITENIESFRHFEQIINTAHAGREMEKARNEIANSGLSAKEIREELDRIEDIAQRTARGNPAANIASLFAEHKKELRRREMIKGEVTGIKSCSDDFNRLSKGHQKQDLIIVAARPSMGKSAWMCNDAFASTEDGTAALMISGEDKSINMLERMISAVGRIELSRMKSGQMRESDWNKYLLALELIGERNIFIDDTVSPKIEAIRAMVAEMVKIYPKMILYVDYLQHLTTNEKFRSNAEKYAHISAELKKIARDFDIPVVALAAMNREVEKKQDKRPSMSDIRDCGNIESDGDVIILLHREDYYDASSRRKGLIDLIVAKGRNAGTGTVSMVFDKPFMKFLNITEEIRKQRREKDLAS
ncbi:replicative DNA helicase [Paenibacillus sp. UASWS1643]|uniref:replicative DNA helicase n=1 Tax=Paenibacillus sp. UASWS1643 TaxID=2580422 RepID=UPI0012397042|nr:DnaB-like helicase C-terminal domain-containing protein [Paenibacillus sp. UASWS1643]KAA8750056.1 AAA family ATPase [Paenibacillus sp. UASWS1643]